MWRLRVTSGSASTRAVSCDWSYGTADTTMAPTSTAAGRTYASSCSSLHGSAPTTFA